ncbi:MAG: hypothetical protein L0Z50_41585 [Verrucomicrobiales bacterium]|nr:hypothetical protein [Verrucomicrobiales bacterium]
MLKFRKSSRKPSTTVWRQGDVFLIAISSLPIAGRVERRPILAEGEVTGHAHRLNDPASGQVFSIGSDLYLEVRADSATIVHEEHRPVTLPRGGYAVRIQREYSPQEIRRVVD